MLGSNYGCIYMRLFHVNYCNDLKGILIYVVMCWELVVAIVAESVVVGCKLTTEGTVPTRVAMSWRLAVNESRGAH